MMLYPAMNQLTAYVPNRYMMVNVVARRARQIAAEAEKNGEHLEEKPVTMAIDEVAEGKFDASTIDSSIQEKSSPERSRGYADCEDRCGSRDIRHR